MNRVGILAAACGLFVYFGLAVTIGVSAPVGFQSAVLGNNPYVYYRLNELSGTSVADLGGNGLGGFYSNNPTLGVAGFGSGDTAAAFNGVSQYVKSTATGFGLLMTNASFEFIFKTTATGQDNLAGTFNDGSTTGFAVTLNVNASGASTVGGIRFYLRDDNGNAVGAAFVNANAFDGNYHHLVFTYDQNGGVNRIKGYLDGNLQSLSLGSLIGTGTPTNFSTFSYNPLVAARANRATIDQYFAGTVDEVAFYASTLSTSDVLNHALTLPLASSFALVDNGTEYVVDTGAGLVFRVLQRDGEIDSWVFNGVEYAGPSGKHSQIESGLGTNGCTVTATNLGNIIVVTSHLDQSNTNSPGLYDYFIVTNGVNNVYKATYLADEPNTGEFRWINRLSYNLLPNDPLPSDNNGSTGAVENAVSGFADGTTTSKYYGSSVGHDKDRAIDMTYCGVTGNNVGVWMVYDNRESSSGGPFFRDIEHQGDGIGSDQELYNYMNSGHAQTESVRLNVLYSPWVIVWNNGTPPTLPIDTSWLGSLGLVGWVGPASRGAVSGSALGTQAGLPGVVGLANTNAQYWGKVDGTGHYTISGVKAGTYTAILYQGELGVVTNVNVTVSANATTTLNLTSTWPNPSKVFQIGDWDGTPQGFLNATNILGFSYPNFISMHPMDSRMDSWVTSGNSNLFNVGSDPISSFPSILMRGTNATTYIKFNLTSNQITNLTLKIGSAATYNGARPDVRINGIDLGYPAAPHDTGSRVWTVGTYRGYNTLWTWSVPASALVVGQNIFDFHAVSGTTDLGPFLSAGWVYDAVELDGPSSLNPNSPFLSATYANGAIRLSWPTNAGWILQSNSAGLANGSAWFNFPANGSVDVTNVSIGVDRSKTNVFFRMVKP